MNIETRDSLLDAFSHDGKYGEAMRELIREKIRILDTVKGADSIEIIIGRQNAIGVLEDMLKKITFVETKKAKRPSFE